MSGDAGAAAARLLDGVRDGWHALGGGRAADCPGCPVCRVTEQAHGLDPAAGAHLQAAAVHLVAAGRELVAALGALAPEPGTGAAAAATPAPQAASAPATQAPVPAAAGAAPAAAPQGVGTPHSDGPGVAAAREVGPHDLPRPVRTRIPVSTCRPERHETDEEHA